MDITVEDILTMVSDKADFTVQLITADKTFEAPITYFMNNFTSWDDKVISEWAIENNKLIIIC
jgi:hypothetical protein